MREWHTLGKLERTNPLAVELEELSFRLALFCTSCSMRSTLAPLNPASDSRLPSSAVYRKAFPCIDVDFRISHVMLACGFVAEDGTTSISGTIDELSVNQVFGDAAIIHTMRMAKPRQAALS